MYSEGEKEQTNIHGNILSLKKVISTLIHIAICNDRADHQPHRSLLPLPWKNPSEYAIQVEGYRYISSLDVPEDGVICQTCRRDITRVVLADPSHTPRWLVTFPKTRT